MSSTAAESVPHRLAHAADEFLAAVEQALQLPDRPESWWHRAGISPRAERWLEVVSSIVLGLLTVAWCWTIATARGADGAASEGALVTPATRAVTSALTNSSAPAAAYLLDATLDALTPLRGASGRVRIVQRAPGDSLDAALPAGARIETATTTGIVQLAVRVRELVRPVSGLNVVTLTPLTERRGGKIGLYYIGSWPTERRGAVLPARAPADRYAPPAGLIEVTRENQDTPLSDHLRLRDFLTHDQANVWPKYVVVQSRIIDKDELVLADLETRGIPSHGMHVMSGFRTPSYNAGGGDRTGRAGLSRHMYGDANDMWIDNDGNGRMDDLNHDGRVDIRDAHVVCEAVERVEREHPDLVGGCGVYPGNDVHGPFAHIDARGYRARWTGGPNGG